jgi:NAD(P) transhydrogenase
VMDLSGFRQWGLYRGGPTVRPRIPMAELRDRCDAVIGAEASFQERLLRSRGIDVIQGEARFLDEHTLRVDGENGVSEVRGDAILIAVGSVPYHPENVPFDGVRVLDSDQILDVAELPRSLTVVGGGVIGSEYASIFSLLDIDVTLINRGAHLLPFIDATLIADLEQILAGRAVDLRLGADVKTIEIHGDRVRTTLADESSVETEALLYCAGRNGGAASLSPEMAAIELDDRGQIPVDDEFRTSTRNIYAAGDVIGFPSLASVSREQGRVAACRALGVPCRPVEPLLPYGIYTVPEIATVGLNEHEARAEGIDVETGIGRYEDTARGQIIGDHQGLLKLVVDKQSNRIIGAHLLGTGATELVHFAQLAMNFGARWQHFVRQVMNYPTLSRVFKVAAWDLFEKLGD